MGISLLGDRFAMSMIAIWSSSRQVSMGPNLAPDHWFDPIASLTKQPCFLLDGCARLMHYHEAWLRYNHSYFGRRRALAALRPLGHPSRRSTSYRRGNRSTPGIWLACRGSWKRWNRHCSTWRCTRQVLAARCSPAPSPFPSRRL